MSLDWYDDKPKTAVPAPPPPSQQHKYHMPNNGLPNYANQMPMQQQPNPYAGMPGANYYGGGVTTSNVGGGTGSSNDIIDADFAALVEIADKVTGSTTSNPGKKEEIQPPAPSTSKGSSTGAPKPKPNDSSGGWNFGWSATISSKKDEPKKTEPSRTATSSEVEKTVNNAISAKQEIVAHALRDKQRRALEESRRLARIDEEMKKLESAELAQIAKLRKEVEQTSTNVAILSKESEAKKAAMEAATAAYTECQERYQNAMSTKKQKEEALVEMILQSGKRKDDKLTALLIEIEKEEGGRTSSS